MLRKNFWSGSLAYKTTLVKPYFIDSEPKGEVISSKAFFFPDIASSKHKTKQKQSQKQKQITISSDSKQ